MRILALDLSTHTGYAVFDGEKNEKPKLLKSGTIDLEGTVKDYGSYPHCYRLAAERMAAQIFVVTATALSLTERLSPDVVVIEEINSGRNRYTQKLLENIHTAVLAYLAGFLPNAQIVYLNSDGPGGWRTTLGIKLTKDQKKLNAKLSKAKRDAEAKGVKLDRKKLGIRGKVNKKHIAVAYANAEYGLKLKQKDNNEADAIGLGVAYCNNATPCTGE